MKTKRISVLFADWGKKIEEIAGDREKLYKLALEVCNSIQVDVHKVLSAILDEYRILTEKESQTFVGHMIANQPGNLKAIMNHPV